MVNDTINEFTSAISKRFGNPFVINFMFSWSFFNYKAILVMVSATPISQKLTVLEKEIWNSWWVITLCGFILPAVFTFIFLYLMPFLVTHLELFTAKIERDRAIEKYKITKETPLSSDMAEKIQSENKELELQNKKLDYTVRVRENELSEEREKFKTFSAVEAQKSTKLTAERDVLANEVNSIRNDRDSLFKELSEKNKSLESIENRLVSSKKAMDAKDRKIEELTKEKEALKAELIPLRESVSQLAFNKNLYLRTTNLLSDLITLFDRVPMNVKNDLNLFKEIDQKIERYHAIANNPQYGLNNLDLFSTEKDKKEQLLNLADSKIPKNDKGSLGY